MANRIAMVVGVRKERVDEEDKEESIMIEEVVNEEQPNLSGGLVTPSLSSTPVLSLIPIIPSTIPQLRSINDILFPMNYQERYYKEVLALDSFSHFGTIQRMVY